MNKISPIFWNALPILILISLIPLIQSDYWLVLAYVIIIAVLFLLKRLPNDLLVFVFGLVAMTVFETIFISTGVETFNRVSLFGLMPVWLPLLWAYGFVAIKRSIEILNK